jgi:hypothetical protein
LLIPTVLLLRLSPVVLLLRLISTVLLLLGLGLIPVGGNDKRRDRRD